MSQHIGSIFQERYEILKQLGAGGFGEVFKARHISLNKFVAIKMMHLEKNAQSTTLIERFKDEAQNTAKLKHPNNIRVNDFGTTEEGSLFIVMDLIDGVELTDLLWPMPEERALRLCAQIAGALHEAHELGMIHRDIKPSNIMVSTINGQDHAYVLDYGIAKVLSGSQNHTKAGSFIGSLQYASPEHIEGKPLDRRTDIYMLGVLLYEILSKELPFTGDLTELIMKIIREPPPPFHRNLYLSRPVELLVQNLLSKSPDDRPSTMMEVKILIENLINPSSSFKREQPFPTENYSSSSFKREQPFPTEKYSSKSVIQEEKFRETELEKEMFPSQKKKLSPKQSNFRVIALFLLLISVVVFFFFYRENPNEVITQNEVEQILPYIEQNVSVSEETSVLEESRVLSSAPTRTSIQNITREQFEASARRCLVHFPNNIEYPISINMELFTSNQQLTNVIVNEEVIGSVLANCLNQVLLEELANFVSRSELNSGIAIATLVGQERVISRSEEAVLEYFPSFERLSPEYYGGETPLPRFVRVDSYKGRERIRIEPHSYEHLDYFKAYNGALLEVLRQECGQDQGRWAYVRLVRDDNRRAEAENIGRTGWIRFQGIEPHRYSCCGRNFDCGLRTIQDVRHLTEVPLNPRTTRLLDSGSLREQPHRDLTTDRVARLSEGTIVTENRRVCLPSGYLWSYISAQDPDDYSETIRAWIYTKRLERGGGNGCCRSRELLDDDCFE